jgi:tRNA/rRNA methyltransferase
MDLSRVVFVLHRPRSPDNVGAAARALANMGRMRLALVDPLQPDLRAARKMAAGADEVLDGARVHRTLDEALEKSVLVVATSARPLEGQPSLHPAEAARALVQASADGEVAVLFGDEKHGLPNRTLQRFAHVCTIPTAGKRALNLAQAVLLLAWEIRRVAGAGENRGHDPDFAASAHSGEDKVAIAKSGHVPGFRADAGLHERLRAGMRETLLRAGFLNAQNPDAVLDEMLRGLQRSEATRREVELWLAAFEQLRRNLVR